MADWDRSEPGFHSRDIGKLFILHSQELKTGRFHWDIELAPDLGNTIAGGCCQSLEEGERAAEATLRAILLGALALLPEDKER